MQRGAWLSLVVAGTALLLYPAVARAHQLWIETGGVASVGQALPIEVCFGHAGEKTTGAMLQSNKPKLAAAIKLPDGSEQALELGLDESGYPASFTPTTPGYYAIGAELQVGIIQQELHGIAANTRIVMYGKSLCRVAGSDGEPVNTLGHDLEIVPTGDPSQLRPGQVVTVGVLFRGKPAGGRNVLVKLNTAGPQPVDDPRIQSPQWSIEAHPDPQAGQVSFPLIVCGLHTVSLTYIDETPGTYDGPLDFGSDFSHLRKGDRFERTMYVATFTFLVAP